jgi:hypothetical protein
MDEVYICELCQHAYEPEPEALEGLKILKTFKGYTVDLRLQQFRKVVRGETWKLIDFASPKGQEFLAQMHQQVTK